MEIWVGTSDSLLITTQPTVKERRTIRTAAIRAVVENSNEEASTVIEMLLEPPFLLTTSDVTFVCLPLHKKLAKHDLKPGTVLAGGWANYAHCNPKADRSRRVSGNSRTAWRLYVGVSSVQNYKYIDHKIH
jgi:hypothetical protein